MPAIPSWRSRYVSRWLDLRPPFAIESSVVFAIRLGMWLVQSFRATLSQEGGHQWT